MKLRSKAPRLCASPSVARVTARFVAATLAAAVCICGPADAQKKRKHPAPDFTRGDEIPQGAKKDWLLGPSGARGWMHSERLTTKKARQIRITAVPAGTPAARVLEVGDVLLGVDGRRFDSDPRVAFSSALTRAEAGDGSLRVTRWRAGETTNVTIPLEKRGAYGSRAPYACAKSKRLLREGCATLARRMQRPGYRPNPIPRCLNALALLASGDAQYLPLVEREVRWAESFRARSFQTWYYGYVMMLLAEYRLATGDKSAMKGLRRLALEAARGQSAVGSWGHKFSQPSGILAGYGMMNAPGVPLTIAMVLAREAGVRSPEVERAIERSARLLRFYVGKGAIPYGDHHPWIQTHEDNGKCGMGAVLFHLLGDREAAEYFARMSLASHGAERDGGHTGNFFNMFWAMPAIALLGEEACGAWMQEFGARAFDFARRADGSFAHQGPPEERPDKYARWDASGAFLLAYALPLRKLVLTGKRPSTLRPLARTQATSVLDAGRGWDNLDRRSFYAKLPGAELLARVDSWSPVVRERAAMAIAVRRIDCVPALIERLASKRLESAYGACQCIAQIGRRADAAVPALRKALESDDLWLRVKAAEALTRVGKAAMPALPDVLATLARPASKGDPRGMEQRYLCFSLFDRRRGLLRRSLDGVDRRALMTAIRAGLQNEDGRARSAVANVYERLNREQLTALFPYILEAVRKQAPSGVMFAHGVRMAGLKILAEHRVREGLDACARYVREQKPHGSEKRTPKILAMLERYGAHAQAKIPELERTARYFESKEKDFPKRLSRSKAKAVRATIEKIRASEARPTLISIE